jgi:hypothetical protein
MPTNHKRTCWCGCGEPTASDYAPGHDSKLAEKLLPTVKFVGGVDELITMAREHYKKREALTALFSGEWEAEADEEEAAYRAERGARIVSELKVHKNKREGK